MGRQITFNKASVFQQCLQAFWQYGYDNTSVRDLQELTGLSGRSLIHSFGDKRQIFDGCLQYYLDFVAGLTQELTSKPNGLALFFESFTCCDASDTRNHGCFVLNSIYGSLKGDEGMMQAFDKFSRILTVFFDSQLKLMGFSSPKKKANVLFSLLLSGLTKVSIYQDAKKMGDEYVVFKTLLAGWGAAKSNANE